MTSVGPPQFDSEVDGYGLGRPDGEPTPRRWILPVALAVAALLLVARLTRSEPEPQAAPETVPPVTTIPTSVPTTVAPAYAGMDLDIVLQAMTATRSAYFAFGRGEAGDLSFLTSDSGIRWDAVDSAPVSGVPSSSEPWDLRPIPGFGFLAAFDEPAETRLTVAQSSDGEVWFPLTSLPYGRVPLRADVVAVSASAALVSVEETGPTESPPSHFVLSLGSGTVATPTLEKFDYVRAAAYDIVTGDLLAVVTREADSGADGLNDRFRWLVDGQWTPVDFGALDASDVIDLGTWSGRIVAITDTHAHVYDRDTGTWETSRPFGVFDRVLSDVHIGVGGAAVVTSSVSDDRNFVSVTADMSDWWTVEIVDELTKLEVEAISSGEVVLVAFRVGVGLQRHPPGLLVRLLSVRLPLP